jgi:hypothetical protein
MGLVNAEQILLRHAEVLCHAAAIFPDIGRIVMRAETAIESGINAAGHPALAGEEGMANAGDR